MELTENNISTIATWISILITGILAYFGMELDLNALIPLISAIITFIIAVWSSKNPNTIPWLGNNKPTIEVEELVLNEEYECECGVDEDGEC